MNKNDNINKSSLFAYSANNTFFKNNSFTKKRKAKNKK